MQFAGFATCHYYLETPALRRVGMHGRCYQRTILMLHAVALVILTPLPVDNNHDCSDLPLCLFKGLVLRKESVERVPYDT